MKQAFIEFKDKAKPGFLGVFSTDMIAEGAPQVWNVTFQVNYRSEKDLFHIMKKFDRQNDQFVTGDIDNLPEKYAYRTKDAFSAGDEKFVLYEVGRDAVEDFTKKFVDMLSNEGVVAHKDIRNIYKTLDLKPDKSRDTSNERLFHI